jgi:MIP family channel proteins
LNSLPAVAPPAVPLAQRLGAEALGTFCLVFGGTGAIVVDAVTGGRLGHGGVAAAFGLAVAVAIFLVGHLSGAHLNPAVTAAMAAGRHFPAREIAPYWGAQLAGALAASAALRGIFGTGQGLGATHVDHVDRAGAFAIEVGLTAALVAVVLAVATDTRAQGSLAALAVGGTIALAALVMGPITGASMNPARSLAPAAVSADWADLWLYIAAPLAGALLGTALYEALRARRGAVSATPDAIAGAPPAPFEKEDALR